MAKSKLKKRPDGLYQISVMVEQGGRKKRKYFYGHTQQEAKRKMMAWQEERARGRSFEELAEEWHRKHWPEIRPGTQVCYTPALKRAEAAFAGRSTSSITPLDIKRAVDVMAAQQYSHKSVATYLSVMNQIFNYAITLGEITVNPTTTISVPKGLPRAKREVPEDWKLDAIRANVEQPFGLFAYMLLYTGLRRGELLALQWRDIDFTQKQIYVRHGVSYARTGNQPDVGDTKTEAGERAVILMDRLIPHLWKRMGKPGEYVFGGAKPMTQSVYRTAWRNYCIGAGLSEERQKVITRRRKRCTVTEQVPVVTPHQLRHAYATMLFEQEIDVKDAQAQLGHSRIDVTLDTYTHIRREHVKDVAAKLNRAK